MFRSEEGQVFAQVAQLTKEVPPICKAHSELENQLDLADLVLASARQGTELPHEVIEGKFSSLKDLAEKLVKAKDSYITECEAYLRYCVKTSSEKTPEVPPPEDGSIEQHADKGGLVDQVVGVLPNPLQHSFSTLACYS